MRAGFLKMMAAALLLTAWSGCGGPREAETQGSAGAEPAPKEAVIDAYAEHVRKLKAGGAPEGFTVVAEPPFVVLGDEPEAVVRQRSRQTVRWATKMLKQDYFEADPEAIIDVWLFKDAASYHAHAKALWGDEPWTPYGYYSSENNALVMNISTGGGTLVHEMVHPFMEANFPKCPAWFNEGLASLYEQSGEADGRIRGYPNWRLPGLQEAIREGALPLFKDLMSTSEDAFYNEDPGSNYAQARYLCYYLQERGLLVRYYKTFTRNQDVDPTGYASLKEVLGRSDMESFQQEWETWALTLHFP